MGRPALISGVGARGDAARAGRARGPPVKPARLGGGRRGLVGAALPAAAAARAPSPIERYHCRRRGLYSNANSRFIPGAFASERR